MGGGEEVGGGAGCRAEAGGGLGQCVWVGLWALGHAFLLGLLLQDYVGFVALRYAYTIVQVVSI